MIQSAIADLIRYGKAVGLIEEEDAIFVANELIDLLHIDALEDDALQTITRDEEFTDEEKEHLTARLESILGEICDYAFAQGLLPDNTVTWRDLFDTKVMGLLTMRPSQVIGTFREKYREDPEKATNWYYTFNIII